MIKINCELCGKATESLFNTVIESVNLNVCEECSKFGKVTSVIKKAVKEKPRFYSAPIVKEEKSEILVEGFHELIKKKRESLGISQKDFAKKIKSLLLNRKLRNSVVKEGFSRALGFSWSKTARETVEVYKTITNS